MEETRNRMGTYENLVYNVISKCMVNDETIDFDKNFDFVLPHGCELLKWYGRTFVEVKFRLIFDSFSKIKYIYDEKVNNERLVLIVIDASSLPLASSDDTIIDKRNIEIKSYESLLEKAELISPQIGESKTKKDKDEKLIRHKKEQSIFDKAKEAIKNNNVSLFLGAGVSASAGVVTWEGLLEQLCIKRNLPKIDPDIESTVKGRYIIDDYKKLRKIVPHRFYKDMKSILYAGTHHSILIASIAKLIPKHKIESIITYNYDDLVEQEVNKKKSGLCYSIYGKSRPVNGNSIPVYHVHGFIPQSGDWSPIVLGEKDYHKIYQESYNWGNVEQLHALSRNVCFFIGLSMSDPNLRRLIDISIDGSEIDLVHFAFLRRIEYDVPFTEKVMSSFGINCIWYEEHKDLPKLLNRL